MRRIKFETMVTFRNLLAKQTSKNIKKPLKTANEVLMLVDAILYDSQSFEAFYTLGDNIGVYLHTDEKNKIKKITIGA